MASYDTQEDSVPGAREIYSSLAVGVWLPAMQAIITAIGAGLTVAGVLLVKRYPESAIAWGYLATVAVFTLAWLLLLRRWVTVSDSIERAVGVDLDGDGLIGGYPEPAERQSVRVELSHDNGRRVEFIELPVSTEKLSEFAAGVLDGRGLTESAWIGSGGIFTRAEFVRLRDELVRRGLLTWCNPHERSRGTELTHAGTAAFRYLAELHSPTQAGSVQYASSVTRVSK